MLQTLKYHKKHPQNFLVGSVNTQSIQWKLIMPNSNKCGCLQCMKKHSHKNFDERFKGKRAFLPPVPALTAEDRLSQLIMPFICMPAAHSELDELFLCIRPRVSVRFEWIRHIRSGNVQRLLIRIPHAYFIHFPRKPKRIMIIYAECDIQVMHRHRSCLESVLLSRTYINVLIYIHIFFCEITQIPCCGIVQIVFLWAYMW